MDDLSPDFERAIERAKKVLENRIVGDNEARRLIADIQTAHFRSMGRYLTAAQIAEKIPRSREWVESYWPLNWSG